MDSAGVTANVTLAYNSPMISPPGTRAIRSQGKEWELYTAFDLTAFSAITTVPPLSPLFISQLPLPIPTASERIARASVPIPSSDRKPATEPSSFARTHVHSHSDEVYRTARSAYSRFDVAADLL